MVDIGFGGQDVDFGGGATASGGAGAGAGTGGGDFGFGDVGQQVAAANAQAAAAAQAVANAQAAQAAAESQVDIGVFGGYVADPAQVAAEAAMGLDPFGGYGNIGFMGPDGTQGMEAILPEVTAPQPICPEGYEYDANLQACRKITMSPAEQLQLIQPATATTPRYARMGLLDQAPMGLLEAGFGSPADYTARNLAFRLQSASVPTYFSDPRSYEGYTLI